MEDGSVRRRHDPEERARSGSFPPMTGALYSTEPPAARQAELVALPYHLWANRAPGSMQVWVAELED